MFETIWKWVSENYPGLTIISIIVFIVFNATKSLMKWYHRFTSAEKECAKIEGVLVPKIDVIESKVVNFQSKIEGVLVPKIDVLESKMINLESKMTNVESKITNLESKMTNVESKITNLESKMTNVESKMVNLQSKVDNVQNSVNSILVYLTIKDKSIDVSSLRAQSPLQLTPLGYKILVDSGGETFVNDNIDLLINKLQKEELKSPLDVEDFSAKVILLSYNLDSFTKIKNYLYYNPSYETEEGQTLQVSLVKLINIIGVYLRDCYFARYPKLLQQNPAP